jgi:probable F420-dependent oxidoreductase
MKLGKLAAWTIFSTFDARNGAAFARRIEHWGYDALWIPEAFGRDPLIGASWILANTTKLNVATGIANIYARDSLATVNAQYALAEQSEDRFLLGVGVSHIPLVEGFRGHKYEKPIAAMTAYLESMKNATYVGPAPTETPKTVIAALGPRMLEVAAKHADGAHPYNVTPEHTAAARRILGADKLLCPEQKVLLETDPAKARAIGRRALELYLTLPNYRNNFLRMGFTEQDMENGGSNRLVDGLVAWGDEHQIRARIQEHWDAGADQVCIQSVPREGGALTRQDERIFELLAPKNS